MNCDVCLKLNKTLYEVFTCGKQELWCLACKDYELGKENEREGDNEYKPNKP
jgi:hypothetical protein